MNNYSNYRNAFSEVLYLIDNMHSENKEKISKKFINFLEENKNYDYIPQNINLYNRKNLMIETRIILSLIYRDYFCLKEDRLEKIQLDKKELEIISDPDYIFKKNKNEIVQENPNQKESIQDCSKESDNALIEVSKFRSFINSIFYKIRKIFHK